MMKHLHCTNAEFDQDFLKSGAPEWLKQELKWERKMWNDHGCGGKTLVGSTVSPSMDMIHELYLQ